MIRRKRVFIGKEQGIQRSKRIQRNRGGLVHLLNCEIATKELRNGIVLDNQVIKREWRPGEGTS